MHRELVHAPTTPIGLSLRVLGRKARGAEFVSCSFDPADQV
jgi:hypothetical protein